MVPFVRIRGVGLPPIKSGTSHKCESKFEWHPGHAVPLIIFAFAVLVCSRCCVHGPCGLLLTKTDVISDATPHVGFFHGSAIFAFAFFDDDNDAALLLLLLPPPFGPYCGCCGVVPLTQFVMGKLWFVP